MQTDLSLEELDLEGTFGSEENAAASFPHAGSKQKPLVAGVNTPADIQVDGMQARANSRFTNSKDRLNGHQESAVKALNFEPAGGAASAPSPAGSLFEALASLAPPSAQASNLSNQVSPGYDSWVPLLPAAAPLSEVWQNLQAGAEAAEAVAAWSRGCSATGAPTSTPTAVTAFHDIGVAVHAYLHAPGSAGLGALCQSVLPALRTPPIPPPSSTPHGDQLDPNSVRVQLLRCADCVLPACSSWCSATPAAALLPVLHGAAFVLGLSVLAGMSAVNDACSAIERRKRVAQSAVAWGGQDLGSLFRDTAALRLAAAAALPPRPRPGGGGGGAGDMLQVAASNALQLIAHTTSAQTCWLPPSVVAASVRCPALCVAARSALGALWTGDVRETATQAWTAPAQRTGERTQLRGLPSHVMVPGPKGVQCAPLLLAVAAAVGAVPPPDMPLHVAFKATLACMDGSTKATLAHGDLMRACGGQGGLTPPWAPPAPPSSGDLPRLSKAFLPPPGHLSHAVLPLLYTQLQDMGVLVEPPPTTVDGCVEAAGSAAPPSEAAPQRRHTLKGMFTRSEHSYKGLPMGGTGRLLSPQLLSSFSGDDKADTLAAVLAGGIAPTQISTAQLTKLARQEGEGQGPVKEAWGAVLEAAGQAYSAWERPRWGGGATPLEGGMSNCTVQGLGADDSQWLRAAQRGGLQVCFVPEEGSAPPPSATAYRVTMVRPGAAGGGGETLKLQLDAALPAVGSSAYLWLRCKQSPLLVRSGDRGVWEPRITPLAAQAKDTDALQGALVLGWCMGAGLLNRVSMGAPMSPLLTLAITAAPANGSAGHCSRQAIGEAAALALRHGGYGMVEQLKQLLRMPAAALRNFAEMQSYDAGLLQRTGVVMCLPPSVHSSAKGEAKAAIKTGASHTAGSDGGGCCGCLGGSGGNTPTASQVTPHAGSAPGAAALGDDKHVDDTALGDDKFVEDTRVLQVGGGVEGVPGHDTGGGASEFGAALIWRTMLDAVWGGLDVDSAMPSSKVAAAVAPPVLTAVRCGARACLGAAGLQVLREYGLEAESLAEAIGGVDGVCMVGPSQQGVGLDAVGAAAGTGDFGLGPMNTDTLHVPDVFRVVYDSDLIGKRNAVLRETLWSIVQGWPRARQLDFVHFVTGSRVLPAAGAEALRVELPHVPLGMQEQVAMLSMLPTAHTCTNSLELPSIWTALQTVDAVREGAQRGDMAAAKQWRGILASAPESLRTSAWAQGQGGALQDTLRHLLEASLLTAVTAGGGGYGLDRKSPSAGTAEHTLTDTSVSASPGAAAAGSVLGGGGSPGSRGGADDGMSSDDDDEILAAARGSAGRPANKASSTTDAVPPSPAPGAAPEQGATEVITLQW